MIWCDIEAAVNEKYYYYILQEYVQLPRYLTSKLLQHMFAQSRAVLSLLVLLHSQVNDLTSHFCYLGVVLV